MLMILITLVSYYLTFLESILFPGVIKIIPHCVSQIILFKRCLMSTIFIPRTIYRFPLSWTKPSAGLLKIMSFDTGDRTWGHLASTEHFGRITESSDYIQVDKENLENDPYYNSTQASHCMIFARNKTKTFGVYNPRAAVLVSSEYHVRSVCRPSITTYLRQCQTVKTLFIGLTYTPIGCQLGLEEGSTYCNGLFLAVVISLVNKALFHLPIKHLTQNTAT